MNSVPLKESEELGEQLVTLKAKCEHLEDHVAEKEEEFEETLWKWQEFQSDMDTCFRNLAMIEKSLDFQSIDDGELEDRRETHQVRTSFDRVRTSQGLNKKVPRAGKLQSLISQCSLSPIVKTSFSNFLRFDLQGLTAERTLKARGKGLAISEILSFCNIVRSHNF